MQYLKHTNFLNDLSDYDISFISKKSETGSSSATFGVTIMESERRTIPLDIGRHKRPFGINEDYRETHS